MHCSTLQFDVATIAVPLPSVPCCKSTAAARDVRWSSVRRNVTPMNWRSAETYDRRHTSFTEIYRRTNEKWSSRLVADFCFIFDALFYRESSHTYVLFFNSQHTTIIPKVSSLNILDNSFFQNLYVSETCILYKL